MLQAGVGVEEALPAEDAMRLVGVPRVATKKFCTPWPVTWPGLSSTKV